MTKDIPTTGLYWTELRIFLEVAKEGSFHLAAHKLWVSHPTVARAVRRLESDFMPHSWSPIRAARF